jgi:hypothetical protein
MKIMQWRYGVSCLQIGTLILFFDLAGTRAGSPGKQDLRERSRTPPAGGALEMAVAWYRSKVIKSAASGYQKRGDKHAVNQSRYLWGYAGACRRECSGG